MNASDGDGDLSVKSVPELIKHLWDLYFVMSLDPALEASADHIKQAALTLEQIRRLAYQVSQEASRQNEQPTKISPKEDESEAGNLNWLRIVKASSPLKH